MGIEVMDYPPSSEAGWQDRLARRAANLRERFAKGFISDSVQVGLKRTAIKAEELPPAPFPLRVRAMTPADVQEILPADTRGMNRTEAADIAMRRELFALMPECGYAIVDETTGRVCYLQWLVSHEFNDRIARLEGLPLLAPHQVMAEGAYVPMAYRGQKVMTAAAMRALAHAGNLGATEVVTFIGETNVPSIKGAARAGFRPYMLHVRRHLLFGLLEFDRFRQTRADDPRFAGKF